MIAEVDATFVDGVFKLDDTLPLPNQTRVHLTVELITDRTTEASTAWKSIQSRLNERPLGFGGQRLSRDELHEHG